MLSAFSSNSDHLSQCHGPAFIPRGRFSQKMFAEAEYRRTKSAPPQRFSSLPGPLHAKLLLRPYHTSFHREQDLLINRALPATLGLRAQKTPEISPLLPA